MKNLDPIQSIPLSQDEKELLITIYRTRLHLFIGAFFTLFMMGILFGQRIDRKSGNSFSVQYGADKKDALLPRNQMKCLAILWLEIPILSVGTFIFSKRVNSLRKDIADGKKYCIYYTVIRKQYFPLTDQYFISLDDPDYLHHEVDASWYDHVSDGDAFPVYFSRFARYAFNKNGSYTLM